MEPTPPGLIMSLFAFNPLSAVCRALNAIAHPVLVRCSERIRWCCVFDCSRIRATGLHAFDCRFDSGRGGQLRRAQSRNRFYHSQGKSVPEAIANLREAMELYLEEFSLQQAGQPLVTTFEVAATRAKAATCQWSRGRSRS